MRGSRGSPPTAPTTCVPPLAPSRYARVCVDVAPAHLDRPFDYLVPDGVEVRLGQRVRVDFAGRRRVGWVLDVAASSDAQAPKPLLRVDGDVVWFEQADLRLYRWVADRYAGTLADVLRHALPPRVAAAERHAGTKRPPPPGTESPIRGIPLLQEQHPLYGVFGSAADGLLRAVETPRGGAYWLRVLPGDDAAALVADLVDRCLAAGRSALVLAPDPASPLPDAALGMAGGAGVDLRGLADAPRARYRAFLRGRRGEARVAVGERGAVFAPLRDLGLVVLDDEANPAWKERRSPRHHAREVALARARMAGATAVLLGDLPSAQLWRLLAERHVAEVAADRATQRQRAPRVEVADLADPRPGSRRARFTEAAARALRGVVAAGGAAVVLAARGGQGTALACKRCRTRRECPACAASVRADWTCGTCGWSGGAFACSVCGADDTAPLHAGAGRLAQELGRSHPDADVVRMEGFDAPGPTRRPAIGIMTRGSVVARPAWLAGGSADVVVLPDADAMLNLPTLDAAEDALRLWFAVARWTGHVVVQTREPRHPAVQALVRWDPRGFWRQEAERRAELRYPPAASLVALRAGDAGDAVAADLAAALPAGDEVLGPDPAGALLVKSAQLRGTLAALAPLRAGWSKAGRRVRVDVDPIGA